MSLFRRQPPADPTPAPTPPPAERPIPPQPAPPPVREPAIPPAAQPVGFETVLGANSTFEGTFSSHANVRIDGTFTGHIDIDGNALIGETAKISADVTAKNISIAGAVRGNVTGKKVQILRTGRVWGDITATALSTEEGAFIDGKISMVSKESTTSTQEVTAAPVAETAPVIEAPTEPDFLAGEETTISDDTATFADDDTDEPR